MMSAMMVEKKRERSVEIQSCILFHLASTTLEEDDALSDKMVYAFKW